MCQNAPRAVEQAQRRAAAERARAEELRERARERAEDVQARAQEAAHQALERAGVQSEDRRVAAESRSQAESRSICRRTEGNEAMSQANAKRDGETRTDQEAEVAPSVRLDDLAKLL